MKKSYSNRFQRSDLTKVRPQQGPTLRRSDLSRPLPFKKYKEIYSTVPRLTVEILLTTSQGILLIKRSLPDWQGMWHIPGGTLYYKETIQHALERIATEEIGVTLSHPTFISPLEYPDEERGRPWGHTVGLMYQAQTHDTIPTTNSLGEQIQVFSAVPANTIPDQIPWIQSVLTSKTF